MVSKKFGIPVGLTKQQVQEIKKNARPGESWKDVERRLAGNDTFSKAAILQARPGESWQQVRDRMWNGVRAKARADAKPGETLASALHRAKNGEHEESLTHTVERRARPGESYGKAWLRLHPDSDEARAFSFIAGQARKGETLGQAGQRLRFEQDDRARDKYKEKEYPSDFSEWMVKKAIHLSTAKNPYYFPKQEEND